jgi:hypothetical protein
MGQNEDKSIMRSLGEFFGHIVRGAKTDPSENDSRQTQEVGRQVQEEHRDGVVLRRTTIEEIEFDPNQTPPPSVEQGDKQDR